MQQALQHLRAPRYCSITHQPMFEGWITEDDLYIKNEEDAIEHAKRVGYQSLQEAYDDDHMYWTSWEDEPEDYWDDIPQSAIVGSLIDEMQALVDTIRTTKYMTEVAAPYQTILDEYRKFIKQ